MTIIAPGSTIGILGGGQLGRMLSQAATQLGYRTYIYADEASGPAADVASGWTQGAYTDEDELGRFADRVDVVTYEFENIDTAAIEILSHHGLVRPNIAALRVAQTDARRRQGRASAADGMAAQPGGTGRAAAAKSNG